MCQLTHSSVSLYARVAPSLVGYCLESTLSAASRLFATKHDIRYAAINSAYGSLGRLPSNAFISLMILRRLRY